MENSAYPSNSQSHGPQQPLKLSKGNWIAIATVIGAGWMGTLLTDGDTNLPIESFYSDRIIVTRVTDETVHLSNFGIEVTPNQGWSYLRRIGKSRDTMNPGSTFANPKHAVLVTITAVEFKRWPPEFDSEVFHDTVSIPIESASPRPPDINTDMVSTTYQHLPIEWYMMIRSPYLSRRYGRIDTGIHELLVEVTAVPTVDEAQAQAVRRLCNQIKLH